eukprot:TRINITY_DN644_c0_g1_i1.p1 TRINITY_DN644_c0_g1~~TRINITY_DN644_c0_g1_i1.p1  ORF type:complete len:319 (+),score=102.88 TRINITY_DN644_c0_g1_i1:116-958(+)
MATTKGPSSSSSSSSSSGQGQTKGKKPQRAAMLTIGDEILNGSVVDSNTSHLASRLAAKGILLKRVEVIGDEVEDIVNTSRRLMSQFDLVFTSGGIGPTHDDKTYEALALSFGLKLVEDPVARSGLEASLAAKGLSLNDSRRRMLLLPHPAPILRHPEMWCPVVAIENRCFVMAGVPSVFHKMVDVALASLPDGPVVQKVNLYTMEREGEIASVLQEAERFFEGLSIGSYPRDGPPLDPLATSPSPSSYNVRVSLSSYDPETLLQAEEFLCSHFAMTKSS